MASGLVIAGFGSGALFFTPMMNTLTNKFSQLPTYLGNSVEVVVEGGKQFATVGGQLKVGVTFLLIPYVKKYTAMYTVQEVVYYIYVFSNNLHYMYTVCIGGSVLYLCGQ